MSYGGSLGKFGKHEGRDKDKYISAKEESQRQMLKERLAGRSPCSYGDTDLMAPQDIEE